MVSVIIARMAPAATAVVAAIISTDRTKEGIAQNAATLEARAMPTHTLKMS